MSGSWSALDRLNAREIACKGELRPKKYTVSVDDDHAQWKYRIAAAALGTQLPGFFVYAVEHLIRHSRKLGDVRRAIRKRETELRRARRRELREERAARRAALRAWKGPGCG